MFSEENICGEIERLPFLSSRMIDILPASLTTMQAIGLGMMILVLEFLVPTVFAEIVKTAIAFLQGAQVSLAAASQLASAASHITPH